MHARSTRVKLFYSILFYSILFCSVHGQGETWSGKPSPDGTNSPWQCAKTLHGSDIPYPRRPTGNMLKNEDPQGACFVKRGLTSSFNGSFTGLGLDSKFRVFHGRQGLTCLGFQWQGGCHPDARLLQTRSPNAGCILHPVERNQGSGTRLV